MLDETRLPDGDTLVEREPEIRRDRLYRVVFHNDHFTTKWFVVHVLERFFRMGEAAATAFMMAVHRTGRGIAGVYARDIAETKAAQVVAYAREYGFPLLVTAEPDASDRVDGDD